MEDVIVDSYLKGFSDAFGYQDLKESEQFERLCFYSLLSDEANHSLTPEDLDDIAVGVNKGIDGIAFIVNGKLLKNITDVDDLKATKQKISVNIYFLQSKRSGSFSDAEIGGFLDTILDFFNKKPSFPLTAEATNYHDIYLSILGDITLITEYNFYAFYCCLGTWNQGTTCSVTIETKKKNIEDRKLFNSVKILPVDKSGLLDAYKKASTPISASFEFARRISIKDVKGVDEAYIGILPFSEFRKLIIDPKSGKLRSLFYDNVRDFLGLDNKVNEKIHQTLNEKLFTGFSLLNNGITIIASDSLNRADNFNIKNYQIVNGCQTSNVLYEFRNTPDIDATMIPVKIVITKDESLRDKIILSTNNQSRIEEEELLALTNFQKQLEEYYMSAKDGIYYERRNNQYATSVEIKKKSIIDIREQIKSFVAMFLDEPNEVSGYFGRVYRERKGAIFADKHLLEPYYIAGFVQYRFKNFLSAKAVERKYNKIRYHAFMLFRLLKESESFQKEYISDRSKKSYFDNLLSVLRDENKCLEAFKSAFSIIDKSGINYQEQKEIYKKSTTNTLIESFRKIFK